MGDGEGREDEATLRGGQCHCEVSQEIENVGIRSPLQSWALPPDCPTAPNEHRICFLCPGPWFLMFYLELPVLTHTPAKAFSRISAIMAKIY